MDDLYHWLTLAAVPGMDVVRFESLCSAIPFQDIFQSSAATLVAAGLTESQAKRIHRPLASMLEASSRWLANSADCHAITFQDPRYPQLLREIKHPPLMLFVQGDITLLNQPQLAIVGSRQPTATGREIALDFASELAAKGLVITSGLARGIDAAAHQGALSVIEGKTIAVCGHGLCHRYPWQHEDLFRKIAEQGALVSEYLPPVEPQARLFPIRNRIIVGLSLGTLVVEAAEKSGSLISANYAAEYNREVFAVPGSIRSPQSAGCHQLIQQGAKLTRNTADILEELAIDLPKFSGKPNAEKNNCQQDLFVSGLLSNVGDEATAIDLIATRAAMPVADVTIALLELELAGAVAAVPGGYIRVRRA
jgi:DNA processing protein